MISNVRKVSHPGKYVDDAINELNITKDDFAYSIGVSVDDINSLINRETNITNEVAEKLAKFFDSSIDFWLNLQAKYDNCACYDQF